MDKIEIIVIHQFDIGLLLLSVILLSLLYTRLVSIFKYKNPSRGREAKNTCPKIMTQCQTNIHQVMATTTNNNNTSTKEQTVVMPVSKISAPNKNNSSSSLLNATKSKKVPTCLSKRQRKTRSKNLHKASNVLETKSYSQAPCPDVKSVSIPDTFPTAITPPSENGDRETVVIKAKNDVLQPPVIQQTFPAVEVVPVPETVNCTPKV